MYSQRTKLKSLTVLYLMSLFSILNRPRYEPDYTNVIFSLYMLILDLGKSRFRDVESLTTRTLRAQTVRLPWNPNGEKISSIKTSTCKTSHSFARLGWLGSKKSIHPNAKIRQKNKIFSNYAIFKIHHNKFNGFLREVVKKYQIRQGNDSHPTNGTPQLSSERNFPFRETLLGVKLAFEVWKFCNFGL